MCKECGHGYDKHYVNFVGVEYGDYGTAFYFVAFSCDVGGCSCYETPGVDYDDFLYYGALARNKRPKLGD